MSDRPRAITRGLVSSTIALLERKRFEPSAVNGRDKIIEKNRVLIDVCAESIKQFEQLELDLDEEMKRNDKTREFDKDSLNDSDTNSNSETRLMKHKAKDNDKNLSGNNNNNVTMTDSSDESSDDNSADEASDSSSGTVGGYGTLETIAEEKDGVSSGASSVEDSSTRCNDDFQWIGNKNPLKNPLENRLENPLENPLKNPLDKPPKTPEDPIKTNRKMANKNHANVETNRNGSGTYCAFTPPYFQNYYSSDSEEDARAKAVPCGRYDYRRPSPFRLDRRRGPRDDANDREWNRESRDWDSGRDSRERDSRERDSRDRDSYHGSDRDSYRASYRASNPASEQAGNGASDPASYQASNRSSKDRDSCLGSERASDLSSNRANDLASKLASSSASYEASNQASCQASNQANSPASYQAANQASSPASYQASNLTSYQASNQASNRASYQASNQASYQAINQASNQATNQASNRASNQTSSNPRNYRKDPESDPRSYQDVPYRRRNDPRRRSLERFDDKTNSLDRRRINSRPDLRSKPTSTCTFCDPYMKYLHVCPDRCDRCEHFADFAPGFKRFGSVQSGLNVPASPMDVRRPLSDACLGAFGGLSACGHGCGASVYSGYCSCFHRGCGDMPGTGIVPSSSWDPYKFTPDQDKHMKYLENQKQSLQLQVQVLTEQVEAQSEKITELERQLNDKKQNLANAEDLLQREILSRSSLETQKLELMSAMSELKLQQAAVERENMELRSSLAYQMHNGNHVTYSKLKKPPLVSARGTSPSSSQHAHLNVVGNSNHLLSQTPSPSFSQTSQSSPARTTDNQSRTPPPKRGDAQQQYNSLPRQAFTAAFHNHLNNNVASEGAAIGTLPNSMSVPSSISVRNKGVAFGRGVTSLSSINHGKSVPNLVDSDKVDSRDELSYSPNSPHNSPNPQKSGIKKIFGKLKRSGSGNLDDDEFGDGNFQRGGVRATAGPRLGWTETKDFKRPNKSFSEWDTTEICEWFEQLGLDAYVTDARRFLKNGTHLQGISLHDMEKELGIKNPLHRKKLQLAILDATDNGVSDTHLAAAGQLNTTWVLRWLDDTGLPQHKDSFLNARVDGRMLHRLTVDDLAALHVTSLLHVISLKRGIQVLRENRFDPNCLIRRAVPDEASAEAHAISRWTVHRVMDWLRNVDLAEYAPNLRGAGVHGALMVYEPKFTGELMATLLNIPPNKTLLRRHLCTHFKDLLGKDIIQVKREAEATLGYIPLTPAAKLKVAKKSQFSLKRKKSKGEVDFGDLVCPLNAGGTTSLSGELSVTTNGLTGTMKTPTKERDTDACQFNEANIIRAATYSIKDSMLV